MCLTFPATVTSGKRVQLDAEGNIGKPALSSRTPAAGVELIISSVKYPEYKVN